ECEGLGSAQHRPEEITAEHLAAARARWLDQVHGDEERATFARQWAACLEEAAASLPARLPALVNVVAATTSGLAGDPHFGEQTPQGSGFDLLVVEEAEHLTESEFLKCARRARRWVLLGEASEERHPRRDDKAAARKTDDRAFRAVRHLPAGRSSLPEPRATLFSR